MSKDLEIIAQLEMGQSTFCPLLISKIENKIKRIKGLTGLKAK